MAYLRIGIGYDIHKLKEKRKLFLGGVEIPFYKGLIGHSDADVVLHAVSDALLGAVSLGDIGEHFPDNDPKYKDIRSSELLKKVYALVRKKGYRIVNLDIIIIAEEPKLFAFKDKMRRKIAELLDTGLSSISVKAKTNEGLGDTGKSSAIAAYAAVLIKPKGRRS